jgi:hypothetical protein
LELWNHRTIEPLNHDKSIQELIILDRFKKHYPGFPKGRIIKSESPDFMLMSCNKPAIGIELTSLRSSTYALGNNNNDDFISDMIHSISKKQEKLNSYRQKNADAYWLIIFADSIEFNGFSLNGQLDSSISTKGFDRMFLFDLFEARIWEIGK